jgi:hypothetical protein
MSSLPENESWWTRMRAMIDGRSAGRRCWERVLAVTTLFLVPFLLYNALTLSPAALVEKYKSTDHASWLFEEEWFFWALHILINLCMVGIYVVAIKAAIRYDLARREARRQGKEDPDSDDDDDPKYYYTCDYSYKRRQCRVLQNPFDGTPERTICTCNDPFRVAMVGVTLGFGVGGFGLWTAFGNPLYLWGLFSVYSVVMVLLWGCRRGNLGNV